MISPSLRSTIASCCTSLLLLLTVIYAPGSAAREDADELVWELGAGITALDLPLYPGSSQNAGYVIPFPYFRFESRYLDVDRGVQGKFLNTNRLRLSVSGGLGVPVNSEDSVARRGMPDLDLVLQVGPSLDVIFDADKPGGREFRLELPLRLAIATDLKDANQAGWLFEPRLAYEARRLHKAGWNYEFLAGLRFATDRFHNYYYEVTPAFATPARPSYTATGGYGGAFTELVASWRRNNLIYFAWARYQYLGSAVFADSPLVEQDNYFFIGIGLNWIFAESL